MNVNPERVKAVLAAAFKGDLEAVAGAIGDEPAMVNARGPHPVWGGEPVPLQVAAERGRLAIVRLLLAAGADPDARGSQYDGWSPLLIAVARGDDEIAALLRTAGATVDAWIAASQGDDGRLAALLAEDPARATAIGPNQATPLHFASTETVARRLVGAGARLDVRDKYGRTAVESTAFGGVRRRGAARYLVRESAADDILLWAALGDADRVRALIEREPGAMHASVQGYGPSESSGMAPIHIAAAFGELPVLDVLLRAGADPNAMTGDGQAPLHLAAKHGQVAAAARLIEAGADAGRRDTAHDATPREWADFFEQKEMLTFLAAPG